MKYCEEHIQDTDTSRRGGTIKVDASEALPSYEGEDCIVGAYQNYLGGGMLGAIVGAAKFMPDELSKRDQATFKLLLEGSKRVLHKYTMSEAEDWDEWSAADYEGVQRRAVSAY